MLILSSANAKLEGWISIDSMRIKGFGDFGGKQTKNKKYTVQSTSVLTKGSV